MLWRVCIKHAKNKIEKIFPVITVLATGGNGQVYRTTTNPKIATGDGVAMVYRAKGRIENMEFIQFHPTALYEPGVSPSFLITEAVRGDGGILRNKNGEAFMEKYDERKDLAPRDIVARAIDNEMKKTGTEHVYLDCRHMDMEKFIHHFPNIYEKCLSIGIDVSEQLIPVAPAAHYSCGGIKTDEWARYFNQKFICLRRMCHHRAYMAQIVWQAIHCWKRWFSAHRCYLDSISQELTNIEFQERYSRLECKRNYESKRNDFDNTKFKRITIADERLCWNCSNKCRLNSAEKTGFIARRNRSFV